MNHAYDLQPISPDLPNVFDLDEYRARRLALKLGTIGAARSTTQPSAPRHAAQEFSHPRLNHLAEIIRTAQRRRDHTTPPTDD